MGVYAHDTVPETSAAAIARRASTLTLEDRVQMCLTSPDAMGCLVCGGSVRRRSGGVTCRECGSELCWGGSTRGVWVA
jgi:hypothetical protein